MHQQFIKSLNQGVILNAPITNLSPSRLHHSRGVIHQIQRSNKRIELQKHIAIQSNPDLQLDQ